MWDEADQRIAPAGPLRRGLLGSGGELQELGLPSLEQIVVTEFEAEAYARTVHRYGDRLGFPKGQRAAEKRLPWGVCGPGN